MFKKTYKKENGGEVKIKFRIWIAFKKSYLNLKSDNSGLAVTNFTPLADWFR